MYVVGEVGSASTRVQLCGSFVVELEGRRVDGALPGKQGRMLFAYLVSERRLVRREEVIERLWPGRPAASSESSFRPLVSRLRHVLGERLVGRSDLHIALPADARVDIEVAARRLHQAESALALDRPEDAWLPAQIAWSVTTREFLIGCDGEWIYERRRMLEEDHLRALHCIAAAGVQLGPPELADAERAARSLIHRAPYLESGYRLLMEALAGRGEVAEALRVHDRLRRLLRDELGVAPGNDVQTVFERLLAAR